MANKEHPYKFAALKPGVIPFLAFLLSTFFYISIFNLSLSALFNNNKFWFCISNTLILIIAADYGVFSPSKHNNLSFHDQYYYHEYHKPLKTQSIPKQESQNPEDKTPILIEDHIRPRKSTPARAYRRSHSEKPKRTAMGERKTRVRRSETVKVEEAKREENEFSKMTDEELKRRVEEFIERCNREIRLEAAAATKLQTA